MFALPFKSLLPYFSVCFGRHSSWLRSIQISLSLPPPLSSQSEFLWNDCAISVHTRYSCNFHDFIIYNRWFWRCLQQNNKSALVKWFVCANFTISPTILDMNTWIVNNPIDCHSPFSLNCSDWHALTSEMPCGSSISCSGSICRTVLANRMLAAAFSMTPCWTRLFFKWCGVSLFNAKWNHNVTKTALAECLTFVH